MAYRIDQDGSIVISGFEQGIGDSPYASQIDVTGYSSGGLTDMRNVNIVSIPGEASVAFVTQQNSIGSFSGNVASTDSSGDTVTYTGSAGTPQNGTAIAFLTLAGSSGLSTGTIANATDTNIYWVFNLNAGAGTFQVADSYAHFLSGTAFNITGNGTGTFSSVDMYIPNYFDAITGNYCVDAHGRAWVNSTFWFYIGNNTRTNANGNGITTYAGYVIVYRNQAIDYMLISSSVWTYGWTPANAGSGGSAMQTGSSTNNPHQPVLGGSDNRIYYPDGNAVSWFSQNTGQTFDPTNTATYTYSPLGLLLSPPEVAQCVNVLGTNLIVGGNRNIAYLWDRTSSGYSPIYIAENVISKIVTVNTNAYLFAGTRGRIYITNGSQAQLFKKMPDHLSGTTEPLYTWGGATSQKNQLYFGISATNNSGSTPVNQYGGVWAIDLDTKALRLVTQLSYGTYAGIAMAIVTASSTSAGFALTVGWNSGASTYGIDGYNSSGSPYTGSQAYITSDLIPVGTFIKKRTYSQVEFKLSVPLVSGESVRLQVGNSLSGGFTDCSGYTNGTYSFIAGANNYSANMAFSIENLEWLKVKVILNSTNSTPSYTRLKELRVY